MTNLYTEAKDLDYLYSTATKAVNEHVSTIGVNPETIRLMIIELDYLRRNKPLTLGEAMHVIGDFFEGKNK